MHTLYLLFAAVLLLAPSCSSRRAWTPDADSGALAGPTPAWIHQPLSWDKLDSISAWLAGDGQSHEPHLVIEGELQLNEGRVLFTNRDMETKQLEPSVLRSRATLALRGFEEILGNPVASSLQLQRAETGKRAALALLDHREQAPVGPRVVGRTRWGARTANARRMTPSTGIWSRITVHHSAEPNSPLTPSALADSTNSIRLIQKYHMQDPTHMWGDIGYHFLIDSSGRVFVGRELRWQGAHAGGTNNLGNIGICLLGDFSTGKPSDDAVIALEGLVAELRADHGIHASRVYAHNDFGGTACPGPWLTSFLDRYR